MHHKIIVIVTICSIFYATETPAAQCSDYLKKAMQDEGLSQGQIKAVCARAERYAQSKHAVFTPEKVRRDLVGLSVGPEALVKVKSDEPNSSGAGAGSSKGSSQYSAYVPVPMGIVFDQTNIKDLRIIDVKTSGNRATLIVYVKTISSYAGKLRLAYEYMAGEWILRQIENISFKAQ
jgi:hypothetical protein